MTGIDMLRAMGWKVADLIFDYPHYQRFTGPWLGW